MFDWNTSAPADKVAYLGLKLQSQSANLAVLEQYSDGTQPGAFIAPEVVEQLDGRLQTLNVNYCKLLVDNLVQRITLTGFKLDRADMPDARLGAVWVAGPRELIHSV